MLIIFKESMNIWVWSKEQELQKELYSTLYVYNLCICDLGIILNEEI